MNSKDETERAITSLQIHLFLSASTRIAARSMLDFKLLGEAQGQH